MPSVSENLKAAVVILAAAEIPDPRREAGSLLCLALGKEQTFLFAHPEYVLTDAEQKLFDSYAGRRAAHEPFQYIAGRQEFYRLDFVVTPDVLIPRPETELLVETAIGLFRDRADLRFCEIGTGSGCISVSILHELKTARAIAADISEKALKIAKLNTANNNVAGRVEFRTSDIFSAVGDEEIFDLIVSNPPYIPADDITGLQIEVKDHEPLKALTDEADGLSIIRKLIDEAPRHLKPGGYLLLEIGFGQSDAVREMADHSIWQSLEILPDFQGIPRVVKLQLTGP